MLTNNIAPPYCTKTTVHNDSTTRSRDEKPCDNPNPLASTREVKLSQPQRLTHPSHENKTELSSRPDAQLIHQREPRLYTPLGGCAAKHEKEAPPPYSQKEEDTGKVSRHEELTEFIRKTIYNQPHKLTPELLSIIDILMNADDAKDNSKKTLLSSYVVVESFHRRLAALGQDENLDGLSCQSSYFKSKISSKLNELLELVKTYDYLFNKANIVVESYNSLNLGQKSLYDQVARKCLFLSEQMGQSALVLATYYADLQLTMGNIINNPETALYRLPTLLKPFISCSAMHLECMVECRLRDLDAINNIAVHKPGTKVIPRKFSSIKHVPPPTLKKPRIDQSQLNDAIFNFCRSLATVELFARSRAKNQMDMLDQGRKHLFELIDRYTGKTGVSIAELLTISDASIVEKYLRYAELLHATEAAMEKHIETRTTVLEKITCLANPGGDAATEIMSGKNSSTDTGNWLQLLTQFKQTSEARRRYPLSDHIMLGVDTACIALNKMIRLEAFQNRHRSKMRVEELQEELYNLDIWVSHLCNLGLIGDENLNACPSYQQLIPIRAALNEVIITYQSDLEDTFKEASRHIAGGQIKETPVQATALLPTAELSAPLKPMLFTNSELHKTINHYLFANNELTINDWNQQQGEQLIHRLTMKKQQLPCTQQLLTFIHCCQHDVRISQYISECRLIFMLSYSYITSITGAYSQQIAKGKIENFQKQIDKFTTLNKKIQQQLQECSKKLGKIKSKTNDQHESLEQTLFAAVQTSLLVNTEHQHHLILGLDLMLEKRKQILMSDFPSLYALEQHVYDASTKKIKRRTRLAKRTSNNADVPPQPLANPSHLHPPGKTNAFTMTPLPGLGFTLDNSPALNNLKIPCLESARECKLTGEQFLDYIGQQLNIQLAVYRTISNDFYSPTPGELVVTKNHSGQISFSHFLTGIRIRLDDQLTIRQRDYFHQHIASQVNALIDRNIPVVYLGSRALQTQLQSLWGAQALAHIDSLPLPQIDLAIIKRATTPRDTDLLVLDQAQLTTVKRQVRKTLSNAAQQNSDLKIDFEITTTDERTEIFYGTKCLSCNLILHKKGHRQPKHWIYVVDLITCVDPEPAVSALYAFDTPGLSSGETVRSRRIDAIIMDELNLVISMTAGPARALMAMIRISILAALEVADPKLDNMARMALIHALDTIHQRFPDPAFDRLATDLRSRTFTVVDHQGELLGVRPPVAQ